MLLPDVIWPKVRAQAGSDAVGLGHRSHLFYAFERGYLATVTKPIHHFFVRGQVVRGDTRGEYLNALGERWMLKDTDRQRQEAFKKYYGKIVELQVAEWLSRHRWTISGLEARGAPTDIQAHRFLGRRHSFEVKYLAQSPEVFDLIVRSVEAGKPIADAIPVYAPPNYLQLRVYEAAQQLAKVPRPRIAVVVVDEQNWHNLEWPLRNGWIDWSAPSFMGNEPGWRRFFERHVLPRWPDIVDEMRHVVRMLTAIWILRHHPEGYTYKLQQQITIS